MSSRYARINKLAWASALTLAAVLAGCGGGGGDGDDSGPPGSIDLTVANRDTVAHATVAGAMGIGGADRVVASGGPVATQRHLAQSLRAARERALAVIGPMDEPCLVSGITRTSLDDRDNNGTLSVGDAMTLQFFQCKDSVEETVNGSTTVTLTTVSANGIGGSLRQDAMAVVLQDAGQLHSVTTTGTMQLIYTESSLSVATMRLVTDGPVQAVVATPVFSDTVTLADGYVLESVIDIGAAPPPGGVAPGSISTTTAGRMTSQSAGGDFTVATTSAIVQYTDDAFPRTGAMLVTGRTGSLRITALSTTDVRLDLDANGDGTIDATTTQRWDWLI